MTQAPVAYVEQAMYDATTKFPASNEREFAELRKIIGKAWEAGYHAGVDSALLPVKPEVDANPGGGDAVTVRFSNFVARSAIGFPEGEKRCNCPEPTPTQGIASGEVLYPEGAWLRCIVCRGLFDGFLRKPMPRPTFATGGPIVAPPVPLPPADEPRLPDLPPMTLVFTGRGGELRGIAADTILGSDIGWLKRLTVTELGTLDAACAVVRKQIARLLG